MKNDELLKACPFGCVTYPEPAFVTPSTYYVVCPFCQAKGPLAGSREEAAEYWNTRQSESWIPVSQKLPEKEGRYFVADELGLVDVAYFHAEAKIFGGHYKRLFWMPINLPKPLIEKGEG